MPPDPERALRDISDDLLAERYGPPTQEFRQRDIDIAELAEANSAVYEETLLRKRGRALR